MKPAMTESIGEAVKARASEHQEKKAARDIIKGIDEWRSGKRHTAKRRWIVELIQNAIDTAKVRGNDPVTIKIDWNENVLKFQHNGGYFDYDELNAVILGGSSKPYAADSEYIGRFGTGLLVTHIISKELSIKGYFIREGGEIYSFEQNVNRAADEVEKMVASMHECYNQLDDALPITDDDSDLWTTFSYISITEDEKEAVKQGIDSLRENLPLLFAFCDIKSVYIDGEALQPVNHNTEWGRTTTIDGKTTYLMNGNCSNDGNNHPFQIALTIKDGVLLDMKSMPSVFVGMPLVETGDFLKLPFAINSFYFQPTQERDSLRDSALNRSILKEAIGTYLRLVETVTQNKKIKNPWLLADYEPVDERWVEQNKLWDRFNNLLKDCYGRIIAEVPLVSSNEAEVVLPISQVFFPTNNVGSGKMDADSFDRFFRLVSELKTSIPRESDLLEWRKFSRRLKSHFPSEIKLYDIHKLRKEMRALLQEDNFIALETFVDTLGIEDPRALLLLLFELLDRLLHSELIEYPFADSLLCDQDGNIGQMKWNEDEELKIDDEVDDDLKTIVSKLGWNIRGELVDKDFSQFKIVQSLVTGNYSNDKVIDRYINEERERDREESEVQEDQILPLVELFQWCVDNGCVKTGLPIVTKNNRIALIDNLDKTQFIVPFKQMGVDDKYEKLYPQRRFLHKQYCDQLSDEEVSERFKDYIFIVSNLPLALSKATIARPKLESIILDESEGLSSNHIVTDNESTILDIPFWDSVIGKIKTSFDLAALLLEFIVEVIASRNTSWQSGAKVECNCKDKSHIVFPSKWLASLKTDSWVPVVEKIDDEKKTISMSPSRQNIEQLAKLQWGGLVSLLSKSDITAELLWHLGFDTLDLRIMMRSITEDRVEAELRDEIAEIVDLGANYPKLLSLLTSDPETVQQVVEHIEDQKKRKEIVNQNKIIGENVEVIVADIIREHNLNVTPIYYGADMEVWPKDDGWDAGQLMIQETSHLIEVKFTTGSRVHLSKLQSETSIESKNEYVVLVIEDQTNLRNRLELELDSAEIPTDLKDDVISCSSVVKNVYRKLSTVPNPQEVEPDLNGYWLKKKLWQGEGDIVTWLLKTF